MRGRHREANSTAAQRYSIAIIFPSVYPSISLGVVRGAGLEPVTIPYPVSRERFCLTGMGLLRFLLTSK
jgi:hypothetical protein